MYNFTLAGWAPALPWAGEQGRPPSQRLTSLIRLLFELGWAERITGFMGLRPIKPVILLGYSGYTSCAANL